MVYFLLLGRKERQPSTEDETHAIGSHHHPGIHFIDPTYTDPCVDMFPLLQTLQGRGLTRPLLPQVPIFTSTEVDLSPLVQLVSLTLSLLIVNSHTPRLTDHYQIYYRSRFHSHEADTCRLCGHSCLQPLSLWLLYLHHIYPSLISRP